MKKIWIGIAVGLVLAVVVSPLYPACAKALRARSVWHRLQAALEVGDHEAIGEVLSDTDRDLHDIRDGRIMYFARHDYTDYLKQRPVRFWKTMEYYLTDPSRETRDKVVLVGGYALIDGDQITFMKFP